MTGVSGEEDSGTASYHAPVVAVAGGKRGCDRIVEDLSSVGVRSAITVSFAVPSWQQAMRRSPVPASVPRDDEGPTSLLVRCCRCSGWLAGWLVAR